MRDDVDIDEILQKSLNLEHEPKETSPSVDQTNLTDDPFEPEASDETQSATLEEKARADKRDPFAGMGPIRSSDSALQGRALKSRAEMNRIRKTGFRHEGKKVVTDDVKILKGLTVIPDLPDDPTNYYVEPVHIEYYIPKESRFAREIRYLYIPLIDPEPAPSHLLLKEHIQKNRFFDLMDIMNAHPEHITDILESYTNFLDLYENLSRSMREAALEGQLEQFRTAFYLCEALSEYEPTLAALSFLGEFLVWNLNWLVRRMNRLRVEFYASDKTVSYFIKRRNMYHEEHEYPYDERFEVLAALFFDQAFPHRGLQSGEEDFFFDIFER